MSARRVAWLLVAGLAVIAFAVWLSSRRHLERDLSAGALVLPGLEQNVNSVTTLTLRKGDGTHATLKKDGSAWRVDERGWPADVGKVRKLLLDLEPIEGAKRRPGGGRIRRGPALAHIIERQRAECGGDGLRRRGARELASLR